MSKLTTTQNKALEFIRETIELQGSAPTLREICSHMGYSAIGSAQDIVAALRKKGFLSEPDKQAARSFMLTKLARSMMALPESGDVNTFVVPCLGMVPAGDPLEAVEEQIGTLRVSISQFKKPYPPGDELFSLQATGESMIEAGILDGDWLVARSQKQASVGDIVIARFGEDSTVKRLMKDKKRGWYLQPENDEFSPIYGDEEPFEIIGQILALQRFM